MSSWHSYPKIYALGHREVKDIFSSEVIIQEKIDGSQISFGIFDGELKIKSKSKELVLDAPDKMFIKAVNIINDIKDRLHDGWTYRGEYLVKPKHNALAYDRIPNNHIILFDINSGHESYMLDFDVKDHAEKLGFECVPTLMRGSILDPTNLPNLIESTSCLGGQKMEGIVVKNYSMFGTDKKVLMAKFVSENFKEIHKQNWKISNPGKNDVIQLLIASLKTEARWHKAVIHLKEKGNLDQSLKDIGNLMKEVDADIKAECLDYISEKLVAWALPNILRGVKGGLPEWYKRLLLNEAYGEKGEE